MSRNVQFLEATERIQQKITTGTALSVLFANEKIFLLALGQLMAVGERTGNMDEMLTSIAKYYEEEFTTVVDGLSTIIEPFMIVLFGTMIGIIVVALYLPVFRPATPSGNGQSEKCTGQPTPKLARLSRAYFRSKIFLKHFFKDA